MAKIPRMNGREIAWGPQTCECGGESYEIYLLRKGEKTHEAAACSECGRITGSVGDGQLRGENIRDYKNE